MIGLKRKTIKLIPHHKLWVSFFLKEKERIFKMMPDVYIEHIGSTAIPNISAKPIIDVAIGIKRMKDFNKYKIKLQKLGFEYHENRGSKFNRFFTMGPAECRTIYIHLVRFDGRVWKKYINFRDALNCNLKLAKQYEKLKLNLAMKFNDREFYTKAKADFIKMVNRGRF